MTKHSGIALGFVLIVLAGPAWIALPILLGLAVGAVVARVRSAARRQRLDERRSERFA